MEKLNSSDLMIGNYLQKDGVIHQIIAISGSITDSKKGIKKAATIRTDKSSEYMFLDHFEPVLLTKDILKRLGFITYTDKSKLIHSECDKFYIYIHKNKSFEVYLYFKENDTSDNYYQEDIDSALTEVKYLHDLQNIFKINRNFALKLKK
jgi:hypothetical protein